MLERSEKIGVYIIGSVWPIIGVIFYIIVLPDSYQGKLLLNILLYSVIFIFPAWILVHLVLQFAEREPVQKPIREAIESLRLELQSAEQELELERSTAENEEQERRAAWEAEEQAAAAARLAERIAVHNARQSPPPPSAPPSVPKTISCPGCGASKLLRPMQSEECDYCGRMLVYR